MTPVRVALTVLVAGTLLAAGTLAIANLEQQPADVDLAPREALAANPVAGMPFADLAKAETDPARKLELHRIAVKRAPRDLVVRAWLVEHHLAAGEHALALSHLDIILRLAPRDMRNELLPAVVRLASDPAFAEALVDALVQEPFWRRLLFATMASKAEAPGSSAVINALQQRDALRREEVQQWIHTLIDAGRWGEAYSLWASSLKLEPRESLPMLWNGGFERETKGLGFGWRMERSSVSYTELKNTAGAEGRAARIVFLGRPVRMGNLEQPLHLPPGQYRLSMRVKAEALRSYQGLQWVMACASGRSRSDGDPLTGTFGWREYSLIFNVPVTGCPGQWLRLLNEAPQGAARVVSGELWVDNVTLDRLNIPE